MKNTFKTNTLALLLPLMAYPSFAVENGADVSSDTYEEMSYFLNISTTMGDCGGQLIAGQWILTARHCTPSWDADDSGDTADDTIVNGDTMSITIYQGVGGHEGYSNGTSRKVYDGDATYYTFGDETDIISQITTELDDSGLVSKLESVAYRYDDEGEENGTRSINSYVSDGSSGADLALIKLENTLQYSKTLTLGDASVDADVTNAISSLSDLVSAYNTQSVKSNDEITFYGWGLNESDDQPDVMQSVTATMSQAGIEITCSYYVYYTEDSTEVSCEDFDADSNTYEASPVITVDAYGALKSDSVLNSGDSGSALMVENVAYGIGRGGNSLTSTYTYIGPYLDWITETVDALNVPTTIELLTGDNRSSMTIQVQNLTSEDLYFTPYVAEGSVSIDYSSCSDVLEPQDTCDLEVTINSASNFSIQMDDTTLTSVNYVDEYTGTYSTSSTDTDSSTSSSSSSSSGGSTGIFSLFGLLFVALTRRFFSFKKQNIVNKR